MLKVFLYFVLFVSAFRLGWKFYSSTVEIGGVGAWWAGVLTDAALAAGALALLP